MVDINLSDIITSGIQIVITSILAVWSVKQYRKQKSIDLEMQKKILVYGKKLDAFTEVLEFIDTYISWLTFDNKTPVRKEINKEELTLLGRKCYNNLCIYCENNETIDLFNKLLGGNNLDLSVYSKLRNSIRKELGNDIVVYDKTKTFYSWISTSNIKDNE